MSPLDHVTNVRAKINSVVLAIQLFTLLVKEFGPLEIALACCRCVCVPGMVLELSDSKATHPCTLNPRLNNLAVGQRLDPKTITLSLLLVLNIARGLQG